ncbi:MAG TPA: hypothetical protein VK106_06275 [Balneolaceae bacterium]|nr:hypothetical protein [Balneolaceae bacterium]
MSYEKNKIAQEIGYLVIAFNLLENCIDIVLFEILHSRTNEFGKIITEGYSFSRKLHLLKKMYQSYLDASGEENGRKELTTLIGKIKSANTKRNKMVHAAWEEYFYDNLKKEVRTRWKTSKGQITELTISANSESILNIKKEIEKLDELLFNFHEKYYYT